MTAQEAFARLVATELHPTLKSHGFSKKALTFYKHTDENFTLVQLQKSSSSTAASLSFTMNVSAYSGRIQRGLEPIIWTPNVSRVPTEPDCQLRQRIGSLLPEAKDVWWTVHDGADLADLGARLRAVLTDLAFPYLDTIATDVGLRDHWRAQNHLSGPEGLALAVLLRDLGPRDALAPLLDRLRAETPPAADMFLAALDRFAATVDPS
jgi:hypothetical protein